MLRQLLEMEQHGWYRYWTSIVCFPARSVVNTPVVDDKARRKLTCGCDGPAIGVVAEVSSHPFPFTLPVSEPQGSVLTLGPPLPNSPPSSPSPSSASSAPQPFPPNRDPIEVDEVIGFSSPQLDRSGGVDTALVGMLTPPIDNALKPLSISGSLADASRGDTETRSAEGALSLVGGENCDSASLDCDCNCDCVGGIGVDVREMIGV